MGGGGGTAMQICGGFKYDVHNGKNYEWEIVEGGNNISRTKTVIFAHKCMQHIVIIIIR